MLIDSDTQQPYIPTPSYFLGNFDIYDREHTLGVELEKYDPNNPKDRQELILKYCLHRSETYRHRFLLYKCLEEALQDENYDFQSLLQYDPEAYSAFPYGWDEMEDTKVFFENIFRIVAIEWKEDIDKASNEDQSTW